MSLTPMVIRRTKAGAKRSRFWTPGAGHLSANPNNSGWWRFRYRFEGLEKLISQETYPNVGLKLARDWSEATHQQLVAGIAPDAKRGAVKAARSDRFDTVALEWPALQTPEPVAGTYATAGCTLETLRFSGVFEPPIRKISASNRFGDQRNFEFGGTFETPRGAMQRRGQMFRHALLSGRARQYITENGVARYANVVPPTAKPRPWP
jgi:hypothetical protein